MPTYTTEDGVYNTTGFTTDILQKVTQLPVDEVTTLVNTKIDDAEGNLKEDIKVPFTIRKELHLGTGYDNQFELGPHDDEFATIADFDPSDGVESVIDVRFASYKRRKPYPNDCDEFTEFASQAVLDVAWNVSGGVISPETTIFGAGAMSVKSVFSSSGYIQYPKTGAIDRQIGAYPYVFFWFRTDDKTVTFILRIYDQDGNYEEQTFTPRYNDNGQFFWLNLGAFTGDISWGNSSTRVQYIRLYVSGACTIYLDNFCFTDEWAYSAPSGKLHVAKADNVTGSGFPSENYPYYVTYSYDPFLASVPNHIKEATEWLTGVKIIDHLRGHKYGVYDFWLEGEGMEPDTPMQQSGMLGLRTKFLDNYNRCLTRYGGGSYGVV